ncbi:hypothetical protein HD599_001375 [Conyzicola lurida]|uniref:SRPBCC domain-containing protein n=1 Tax=Conyzicola lurida TaxID=1172621 RepID=A0A841AM67_9MICO|nr:SRPBCC domain-containing protein [Conyzicola lurida]MBB5843052.1 hypothetical protein [Conyzicola lurida]
MTTATGQKRRFDWTRAVVGGATIVAVLVIAALWQRTHPYSIETSVDIDASPREVWAALTDLEAYPEWNPSVGGIRGDLAEGGTVVYQEDGSDVTGRVVEVVENEELRWETHAGVIGVFDGERTFTLEELADGRTRFTQSELFRGVTVLFVTDTLHDEVAPSFHAMNDALRDRVEGDE